MRSTPTNIRRDHRQPTKIATIANITAIQRVKATTAARILSPRVEDFSTSVMLTPVLR